MYAQADSDIYINKKNKITKSFGFAFQRSLASSSATNLRTIENLYGH
jgi:hypothetical protein